MTAETLLSPVTLPLKPEDSVEQSIDLMTEFRVRHLPVVNEQHDLLGVMSETQLLDEIDWDKTLNQLLMPPPVKATEAVHAFDLAKLMNTHQLTTLPIVDQEERYLGLVERKELFDRFCKMLNVDQAGAIVVLEVKNNRDYSLAQIAHVLEQHNVRLLSLSTETPPDTDGILHITLKLSTTDSSRVRAVLEHYGYRVIGDYGEAEDHQDLQYRVQAFLRYLEV